VDRTAANDGPADPEGRRRIIVNIAVLLKRVPDSASKIKIDSEGKGIVEEGVKFLMNPYDEHAVEEALATRDKVGGESTVTVISAGPDAVVEVIRTALAMGADKGVHVKLDGPALLDSMTTGEVLAAAVNAGNYDLVFAGKQGIDMDSAQAPAAVAARLGWPQVYVAVGFELSEDGSRATVRRLIEGAEEVVETGLPCVITCEKGLNEPRYASLPGIMKAKSKPVQVMEVSDTGVDPSRLEADGSKTSLVRVLPLPEKTKSVRMIEGEPEEQARELVRLLGEEAKVI
jgi:electron transfer flavoprotein beta subunit